MDCIYELNAKGIKALEVLKNECGTNETKWYSYVSTIFKDNTESGEPELTDGFKKWWADKYKEELDLHNVDPVKFTDAVENYYSTVYPSVEATRTKNPNVDKVKTFGYSSILAREQAKNYVADVMYLAYINTDEVKRGEKPDNRLSTWASQALTRVAGTLAKKLAGDNKAEYVRLYKEIISPTSTIVQDIISSTDNTYSSQIKNIAALYAEISDNITEDNTGQTYQKSFFDEVLNNKRIANIFLTEADNLDDIQISEEYAETQVEDSDTNQDEAGQYSADDTIRQANEHFGELNDYNKHIKERIKTILNSLYKRNADGSINLDNELGLPELMSVEDVSSILYRYASKDNHEQLTESIKQIATALPGYGGLIDLYNKLKADSDLEFEFFTNFGKYIIPKFQTILGTEGARYTINNRSASKRDALSFEYSRGLAASALRVDTVFAQSESNRILDNIKSIKQANVRTKKVDDIVRELTAQLMVFYPTIQESAINSYVNDQRTGTIKDSLKAIQAALDLTIKNAENIQASHIKFISRRNNAIAKNKQFIRENAVVPNTHPLSEFEDIDKIEAEGYMKPAYESGAKNLANLLLNHALVKVNLNSPNVHGNQSSDVINNSHITNLLSILQSELNTTDANGDYAPNSPLQQYGDDKLRAPQYALSNILIEHEGVNYGLFRLNENGKYVPTNYARELLSFTLFNGAQNTDTDNSVLYSEMSKGDYIGTAWINYFTQNKNFSTIGLEEIPAAQYFLRIPSDAPKTFIARAPRYAINGDFFITKNQDEVNQYIQNFINSVNKQVEIAPDVTVNEDYDGDPINESTFLRHIQAKGSTTIYLNSKYRQMYQAGERYITFKYDSNVIGEEPIYYTLKGDYKAGVLENAEFVAFVKPTANAGNNISFTTVENIITRAVNKDIVDKGYSTLFNGQRIDRVRSVNREHVLFSQLRNIAKQELNNVAVALSIMFNKTKVKNGNTFVVTAADKSLNERWNQDLNGLVPNYHFKGTVFDEDGNLTGNVFHSDRFTVFNENDEVVDNFGERIFKLFDFFYGGVDAKAFTWSEKVVTVGEHSRTEFDVQITPEVQEQIDTIIEEFVNSLVDDAFNRLSDTKNFIRGAALNVDNVADFMLNHHIMYNNFGDILEGDSKYYKDTQTFFKRAKEYQGSGVRYGIANIAHNINLSSGKQEITSSLDSKPWGVKLYDRFNAITIRNTTRYDEDTLDRLAKILQKSGKLSKDAATLMMDAYKDNIVNDAQSYITLDEFVRRIAARGQLYKYEALINKLYDPDAELTAEDITQFVQVQKNFYYDLKFNPETLTEQPRQIKNAEFVLIPKFIKGTELEKLHDFMKKYDIDQVNTEETSKASKGYILEVFDKSTGDIKKEILDDLDTDEKNDSYSKAKEEYSYTNLYTQQETPQHVDENNKIAIQIQKKIIDNIPVGHKLYDIKQEYFRLLTTNVRDSFTTLMNDFNIPLDKDGHIDVTDIETLKTIDWKKFYDKLKSEMARLGLDENMLDYVTIDPNGITPTDTIMPNYMSIALSKLENILQSIITNNITSQKIYGFHAAQVSNIGFKHLADKTGVKKASEVGRKLAYHPVVNGNQEHYVEVMLSYKALGIDKNSEHYRNMSDEDIIKELEAKKLDRFIGYRIPTEGKQSICVMKIAGFLNDSQGSTIVVPDEWVAQTGSDFDIDSVYGIQKRTYKDDDGALHRIEYKTDKEQLYRNYVLRNLTQEQRDDIFKRARLTGEDKRAIAQETVGESYEYYLSKLDEEYNDTLYTFIKQAAKENGLKTFDEYSTSPVEEMNSRYARDNRVVEIMLEIMQDESMLEENLSRSNFDTLRDSRDAILSDRNKNKRKGRSVYNVLDQADNHEDAMSGARLKGFSVARDTLCSIFNTTKPNIVGNAVISIKYSFKDLSKADFKKKAEELKSRFDVVTDIDETNKTLVIRHNTIGWSKDNKNVDGKLITPYSSQTTAHILDAIKEGSIPNVNEYTFGVYKTLVDIGSNYDTTVSFIMQPGIKRIVDEYNKTNSIYTRNTGRNYIDNTIRSIAKDLLGDEYDYKDSTDKLLEKINSRFGSSIQKMYSYTDLTITSDYSQNKLPNLDYNLQRARLLNENEFNLHIDDTSIDNNTALMLHDLVTVLQFAKFNVLSTELTNLQMCLNPDKFGAKQTIFATEQVFENIADSVINSYSPRGECKALVQVDGRHILEAIYPDLVTFDSNKYDLMKFVRSNTNVKNSKYPTLCAHLKYGSATSVIFNKTFFITQSPQFTSFIKKFNDIFSDNYKVDEKTRKEIQDYVIGSLYKRVGFINMPLKYVKGVGFDYNSEGHGEPNTDEYERVYGYNRSSNFEYNEETDEGINRVPIVIEDFNNPTQEEVDAFAKLSPAQKIEYIKTKLNDVNVFTYINTTFNTTIDTRFAHKGAQLISFEENSVDLATVRQMMYEAFTSTNPLIACAAADIIKYAFIVEGYSFARNSVSKLIPNSLLLDGSPSGGTDIVASMNDMIRDITQVLDERTMENFIRSHSNMYQISTRNVDKVRGRYELNRRSNGMIVIPNQATAEKYGIVYKQSDNSVKLNSYVKLIFGDTVTLYKINSDTQLGVYLTPLNLLETRENSEWSSNAANNKHYGINSEGISYFDQLVTDYRDELTQEGLSGFVDNALNKVIDKLDGKEFAFISKKVITDNTTERDFDTFKDELQLKEVLKAKASELKHTSMEDAKPFVLFPSLPLGKYIPNASDESKLFMSIAAERINKQNKKVKDGTIIVMVEKVPCNYLLNTYVKRPDRSRKHLTTENLAIINALEKIPNIEQYNKFEYLYKMTEAPTNTETSSQLRFSTRLNKTGSKIVSGIQSMAYGDRSAEFRQLADNFRAQGITSKESIVEQNIDTVIVNAAKTIPEYTENLIAKLNSFMKVPGTEAEYYKITDKTVIDALDDNPQLQEDFLRTLLEPVATIKRFGIISDLDIKSEDPRLQPYLNRIKDAVEDLRTLPILKTAEELYIKHVVDKQSTNPLIKKGYMSVIDGFYTQDGILGFINSMFNDIQEAPNALVQVTMKNFMRTMRQKRMQADRDIAAFEKKIADIKEKARKAGKEIDYSHIFDEYGRFMRHYKDKLIEDRDKLKRAVADKEIKYRDAEKIYGFLSKEHVSAKIEYEKALLEYNKWKAKYLEQEVINYHNSKGNREDDGYYNERNKYIETLMSIPNGEYTYAVYQLLREQLKDIRNQYLPDTPNEELDKKRQELENKIGNLSTIEYIDSLTGELAEKALYTTPPVNEDEAIQRVFLDKGSAQSLSDFIKRMQDNERKYYMYNPSFNFEQQVEDNLEIVRKAERRDINGIPTVDQEQLLNNEEYQRAKMWLNRNARIIPILDDSSEWLVDLDNALDLLGQTRESYSPDYVNLLRKKVAKDAYGIPDPRSLTEDEIRFLREAEENNYKRNKENYFTDRNLISNAKRDDLVYTRKFFEGLSGARQDTKKQDLVEYQQTITAINNILAPYYSSTTGEISFSRMIEDYNGREDELRDIFEQLNTLYDVLDAFARENKAEASVKQFMEDNCETDRNMDKFRADKMLVESIGKSDLKDAFDRLISRRDVEGENVNRYLYTTFKLKHPETSAEYKQFVDVKRTEAKRLVDHYMVKQLSKYYYMAENEARNKGREAYKKWYLNNHVYDPYKRAFVPIRIWYQSSIREDLIDSPKYYYEPMFPQKVRTPRNGRASLYVPYGLALDKEDIEAAKEYDENLDMENKNYKKGFGHGENYISGTNSEYDNPITMNAYEKEMSDAFKYVLESIIENDTARDYLKKGWLPARAMLKGFSANQIPEELAKTVGFDALNTGYQTWTDEVDYANDRVSTMPMMSMVKNKDWRNIDKEWQAKTGKSYKPYREDYGSVADYLKAKQEYEDLLAEINKANKELHKQIHDKDYETVVKDFIIKASQYNAVQHGKYQMYFTQKLLRDYGVYKTTGRTDGSLAKDGSASSDEKAEYKKEMDKRMVEQFDTTIRRLIYDEWKAKGDMSKWMNVLQSFTSSKYMMMNIKGGIANVTYGDISIFSENFAKEYIDTKTFIAAKGMYYLGIHDYLANNDKLTSTTKQGAIIKFFDVVDYDERNGVGYVTVNFSKAMRKIRDFGYSPQSAGEHTMQNTVLMGMLMSHRLFEEIDPTTGKRTIKFKNYNEYINDIDEQVLLSILDEQGKAEYKKFKEDIINDANAFKDYATFKYDFASRFGIKKLSTKQKQDFKAARKEAMRQAKKDFNDDVKHPTIMSQLELGSNGRLAIVGGSMLSTIDNNKYDEEGNVLYNAESKAIQLLADFKGRVIAVNKKIHGVYDKSGRAQFETKSQLGGVTMQYHKHLPIGILKRYRTKGYYNEERGTVEKGSYISALQFFISLPFDTDKAVLGLSDQEVTALQSVQNMFKSIVDFTLHLDLYWALLPEYDKANIYRNLGDIAGCLAGLAICIGVKIAWDDEDSPLYNLALYEADRLATEAGQYLPWVAPTEGKKTLANPIAGLNGINDLLSEASFLAHLILQGDDFESTYTSGAFAGRNKAGVYLERNVPIWRGIRSSFIDIVHNNHYYKYGQNILGFVDTDKLAGKAN